VESVADHSFSLAILALYEGERRGYNMERILKLALIHDLEEAITGDFTPEHKRRLGLERIQRERQKATNKILGNIPTKVRPAYRKMWTDLRLGRSREARLVHQLDKVEMAFQAHEYRKRLAKRSLQDFYGSARKGTTDPVLKQVISKLANMTLN